MTLPASGTLTFSQIQTEHGGSNPISLNEYYREGSIVPFNPSTGPVPTSGTIAVSDFYSTEGFEGSHFEFTAASTGGKIVNIGVDDTVNTPYGTYIRNSFSGSISATSANFKTTSISFYKNSEGFHGAGFSRNSPNDLNANDLIASNTSTAIVTVRTSSSTGPVENTSTIGLAFDQGPYSGNTYVAGDRLNTNMNVAPSVNVGTTYFVSLT